MNKFCSLLLKLCACSCFILDYPHALKKLINCMRDWMELQYNETSQNRWAVSVTFSQILSARWYICNLFQDLAIDSLFVSNHSFYC